MYHEDFFIEQTLGGVHGWCRRICYRWRRRLQSYAEVVFVWCEAERKYEWSLRLLYYKVTKQQIRKSQVLQLRRLFYTTGTMSRSRGEHHKYSKRWRNSNS